MTPFVYQSEAGCPFGLREGRETDTQESSAAALRSRYRPPETVRGTDTGSY